MFDICRLFTFNNDTTPFFTAHAEFAFAPPPSTTVVIQPEQLNDACCVGKITCDKHAVIRDENCIWFLMGLTIVNRGLTIIISEVFYIEFCLELGLEDRILWGGKCFCTYII